MNRLPDPETPAFVACVYGAGEAKARADYREALEDGLPWRRTVAQIARAHGLTFADIVGLSRKPKVVVARDAAAAMLRGRHGFSTTKIGQLLGGRDHSTVIHALRREARR